MSANARRRLTVDALGATVSIDVADDRLWAPIQRAWASCATTVTATGPSVSPPALARDPRPDEFAACLQELTQRVTREAISARAGQMIMFHAGALCDQRTGAALAFVAPGGTGKTTVVRTLGAVPGRGYVTDETVAVSDDRSIETYCKPLSVRRPDASQPKDEVAPTELGLVVPRVRPWLSAVVVLSRDLPPGRPPEVEAVETLDALVMLSPETSSIAKLDRPLHRLAALLTACGGLRRVRYHDASDLEDLVEASLGRSR